MELRDTGPFHPFRHHEVVKGEEAVSQEPGVQRKEGKEELQSHWHTLSLSLDQALSAREALEGTATTQPQPVYIWALCCQISQSFAKDLGKCRLL